MGLLAIFFSTSKVRTFLDWFGLGLRSGLGDQLGWLGLGTG